MSGPCQDDVSVVAKAIWLVMQRRDFKNFERIVDFLELIHEQAPGLLCYRHHARLSAGLRGKIVINMVEDKKPLLDILEALNHHFPPVCSDEAAAPPRDVTKVQQSKVHFRKLVLHMIRDEKFRQNYLETTLQAEYGEMFLKALEKLLWEFLCRLQAALAQEVTETTEQSLERNDPVRTPTLPVTRSTSDKTVTVMQQDRSYRFHTEEPQNALQSNEETHQIDQERGLDSPSEADDYDYDSDQTIIECEGSQQTDLTRFPSDPTCSHDCSRRDVNQSSVVEEHRPPFFDIFGFDCSESSKANNHERLSPPNPLQSEDLDHHICSELGNAKNKSRGSLDRKNSRGGTKVANSHALPAHEQRNSCVSRIENKEWSEVRERLPQELTSWRFQPKVHLKPLPPDLLKKYVHPQPDCIESDSAPSAVCSELTQNSSCTYSWLSDSGVTPDDYINDPDYYPGCDIYRVGFR